MPLPSRIWTLSASRSVTAMSGFPLRSKSPTAIPLGSAPTAMSSCEPKAPLPSPNRTATSFEKLFAVTRSRSPSRSKSPAAMPCGPLLDPSGYSVAAANVPSPAPSVTETLPPPAPPLRLDVARSRSPSRSKSPAVMCCDRAPVVTALPAAKLPLPSLVSTLAVPDPAVLFETARSASPSRSKSPLTRPNASDPAPKVVAGLKAPPPLPSQTATSFEGVCVAARSRSPSPSKSALTTVCVLLKPALMLVFAPNVITAPAVAGPPSAARQQSVEAARTHRDLRGPASASGWSSRCATAAPSVGWRSQ